MTRQLGLICTLLAATACSNNFDGNGDGPDETPVGNPHLSDDDGDGYTEQQGDCDDSLAEVYPGAEEIPYDGLDNDCKSSTRDDDLDRDGYGIEDDCDDDDKKVNPGADEEPYNGIDDDCNDYTLDDDLDEDGFVLEDDCDDEDEDIHPDADEITDNEIDDDCDGETDERFDVEVIDASCDCGASSAIGVDRRGSAHVVYADADAGTILYKIRSEDGQWSDASILVDEPGYYAGEHLDITLDSYDRPHVAFTLLSEDGVTRGLYYVSADVHGNWSAIYPVDDGINNPVPAEGEERTPTDVGWYVDIKVTSTNSPVFAYMDNNRGVPVVAAFSQNGETESLDQDLNITGTTGEFVSLAIDNADGIHTVYHNDGFMNDVRYTHWDSYTFSEVVDPRPGIFTTMTMIENEPCVSFYDDYEQDLLYGCRQDDGSWLRQQVLKDGNVGAYSSLVVTKENVPNILYYDGNSDSLRMMHKPTIGGWKQVEVDQGPGAGAHISAAAGPNHNLFMSYYDQGTGALKFAVGQ